MIYTTGNKNFKHHVHATLQKRIRIFFVISAIMLVIVLLDIWKGTITFPIALAALIIGSIVGLFTSRIFHLTWDKDGENVVGKIDRVGWFVLAAYIAFEIARAIFFETVVHLGTDTTTAITFAVVSSALLGRVFGLRGRIVKILKDEKIFG